MSLGLPRRTQAGVAAGLALAFVFMASSPALADHVRSQEWWLGTLHVTRAWRTTQGAGVTVALLDTGVDPKQADLTGSVITGPDYTHSGRTPDGPFWGIHGTAMASLIAGHGHGAGKRDGVMGVAPAAKILSVRVTLEGNDPLLGNAAVAGGLPGAIARGIRYAVRRHAAVIDLPLDPVTKAGAAGSGGGPAERAAVSYALDHHVVLVAPAGDGGATGAVNYPAAYPGVISVGAFNEKFIKAPFSSHRAYVALTAAGDGVTAANGPTGYALLHSTSAASAVVAGIVALIKAQFPRLTPGQVRDVLTKSTVFRPKGGRGDGSGFGTVDATAALMAASTMAEAVPSTAAAGGASPAPPSAPAVHNTVVRKNLGHSLITDAALAVAVFLVLLGAIFGYKTLRRRRARSARLAEVRAATRVSGASARSAGKGRARQTRKPAARKPAARKPAARKPAAAGEPAPATTRTWPPATAGAGTATSDGLGAPGGPALPGGPASLAGAASFGGPAPAPFGGASGTWGAAQDGRAAAGANQAGPMLEPVGFVPAPLGPGAADPGTPGPAFSGFTPPGSAPADGEAPGGAAGAPPWSPITAEPGTRFRGSSAAAIPDSAFPVAPAGAEPGGEPGTGDGTEFGLGGSAGAGRAGSRRAQGSHRAAPQRQPTVSGSPPWEPAPEPDSELPWTQAPAPPPSGAGLPQRQPARPEMPTWDAIAEDVWPGGPRAARPSPPAPPRSPRHPRRAAARRTRCMRRARQAWLGRPAWFHARPSRRMMDGGKGTGPVSPGIPPGPSPAAMPGLSQARDQRPTQADSPGATSRPGVPGLALAPSRRPVDSPVRRRPVRDRLARDHPAWGRPTLDPSAGGCLVPARLAWARPAWTRPAPGRRTVTRPASRRTPAYRPGRSRTPSSPSGPTRRAGTAPPVPPRAGTRVPRSATPRSLAPRPGRPARREPRSPTARPRPRVEARSRARPRRAPGSPLAGARSRPTGPNHRASRAAVHRSPAPVPSRRAAPRTGLPSPPGRPRRRACRVPGRRKPVPGVARATAPRACRGCIRAARDGCRAGFR